MLLGTAGWFPWQIGYHEVVYVDLIKNGVCVQKIIKNNKIFQQIFVDSPVFWEQRIPQRRKDEFVFFSRVHNENLMHFFFLCIRKERVSI